MSEFNWSKLPGFIARVFAGRFGKAEQVSKRRKLRVVIPRHLVVNGYNLKKWKKFLNAEDPFNPGNTISGCQCMMPNMAYGALYITHVNGAELANGQFVWATPKMHYPHDEFGRFRWPKDVRRISCFEKVDGTNILQFKYFDDKGAPFVSYKTRLQPFMKEDFARMWLECIERYPDIPKLWEYNHMNISYEMYGMRNLVLVKYDVDLAVAVLFGRRPVSGQVLACDRLETGCVPKAKMITKLEPDSDFTEEYWKIKDYLNGNLKVTHLDEKGNVVAEDDDASGPTSDLVEGLEGCVMYALGDENNTVQFKCKPDYVMDIHIKSAVGVPKHSILITVRNAFEDMDVVTVEHVIELLKEEFQEQDIYKKMNFIRRLVNDENLRQGLKRVLVKEYARLNTEDPAFDINTDKGKVMRYFAGTFMRENGLDKKQSSKVYHILNEEFGFLAVPPKSSNR